MNGGKETAQVTDASEKAYVCDCLGLIYHSEKHTGE